MPLLPTRQSSIEFIRIHPEIAQTHARGSVLVVVASNDPDPITFVEVKDLAPIIAKASSPPGANPASQPSHSTELVCSHPEESAGFAIGISRSERSIGLQPRIRLPAPWESGVFPFGEMNSLTVCNQKPSIVAFGSRMP